MKAVIIENVRAQVREVMTQTGIFFSPSASSSGGNGLG